MQLFVEDCFQLMPKDLLRELQIRQDLTYWHGNPDDQSEWFISVNGNEPQTVFVEWINVTYGKRAYFRCICGYRAAKLYLPLHGHEFKCRNCHNLQYRLTTFNRKSLAGSSLYRMNRLHKLANNRADISRIFYNGEYTKRFGRFLGQCERAGLVSVVKGVQELKALIDSDYFNEASVL